MAVHRQEKILCNVCGADDYVIIQVASRRAVAAIDQDVFRSSGDEKLQDQLVKCRSCGLVYVNPRPDSSEVLDAYRQAVDPVFVSQAESRERTFKRCLQRVERYWNRPPGAVLDIGTANGSFLKVAKERGWQVAGCEPNRWLGQWCHDHYGIELYPGTVFEAGYRPAQFDVITLWDVLEHTPDPAKVLGECRRLLRPGGCLIVNYPDYGAWISRLMGSHWVFLLSVHYYYYTRSTMRRALEQSGFEVDIFCPHFQTLECDYILFRAQAYLGKLALRIQKMASALGMSRWPMPYWVGQTLVLARQPGDPKP